jgi:hypothetical protein
MLGIRVKSPVFLNWFKDAIPTERDAHYQTVGWLARSDNL